VSAPVFATVAQQVLEYLGVPHDQPLKTKKEMMVAEKDAADEAPSESMEDLTAMFDDVNSLPADDPLRKLANAAAAEGTEKSVAGTEEKVAEKTETGSTLPPTTAVAAFRANGGADSATLSGGDSPGRVPPPPKAVPAMQGKGSVVVNAGLRVPVPSFEGAALRGVVEKADAVGLRVQAVGSGLAREQVPAAGTMVPAGTEVVVRFAR
jgi:cell division protein FtsI (penicillin-binding protein 3)